MYWSHTDQGLNDGVTHKLLNLSELSFLLCKVGIILFSHGVARRVKRKRGVKCRDPER